MCRIERSAVKEGLTARTARWICDVAKQIGLPEKKLYRAVKKLARHGVWLEEEDWLILAKSVSLKYFDQAVDYVLRRVASGVKPQDAVKELPQAVAKAGKLEHIKAVIQSLLG